MLNPNPNFQNRKQEKKENKKENKKKLRSRFHKSGILVHIS